MRLSVKGKEAPNDAQSHIGRKRQRTQKTLSDTVSGLSAKLVLSKLKVKHLNEAQGVEEKKLKRKKKIADEIRASDGSGTLFMSPSEIQKARDIVSGRE